MKLTTKQTVFRNYLAACCDEADRRIEQAKAERIRLQAECKCPMSQRSRGSWEPWGSEHSYYVTHCFRCGKKHVR
jgi:hypothetical protein